MDDDVAPEPVCLERLLQRASADRRVLVPLRITTNSEIAEAAARDLDLRKWWSFTFKGPSIAHEYARIEHLPETIPLADFSFEGPLFHRSILEQIGYPRPDFFFQGDDTEYACRIRFRAKAEMICVTDARIVRLRGMVPDPPVNDWRHYYGLSQYPMYSERVRQESASVYRSPAFDPRLNHEAGCGRQTDRGCRQNENARDSGFVPGPTGLARVAMTFSSSVTYPCPPR